MDLNWEVAASCASAAAAIVALFISLRQSRMANRQSLFNRRLSIWITVEKLMGLYRENSKLLKQGDEPQLSISLGFAWLTNTTLLQGITPAISHALDSKWQLTFHLKLDEMRSLSKEAAFVFKGKPNTAVADFINAYQALLMAMYQYQIVLNEMESGTEKFHWTLEDAIEGVGEKRYRMTLYDAENHLAATYEKLNNSWMLGRIERQIRLDSTLFDFLSTFR